MIPEVIHVGIFGGYKPTVLDAECLASMSKHYKNVRIWSDADVPFASTPILMSNYFKYWVLHEHGGICLDTDVQVLKPFDHIQKCFLAFQRDDNRQDCINTAVLGAEKGDPFMFACLQAVKSAFRRYVPCPIWMGCGMPTRALYDLGMEGLNVEQMVGDVKVYDTQAFYPWRWDETPAPRKITEKTFAIHHWQGSWTKHADNSHNRS